MGMSFQFLNRTVASLLAIVLSSGVSWAADQEKLDRLYGQLQDADPAGARRVARDIEMEWSKSGSPAMDLLLKRGTDALEAGDMEAAIGHFTALTDHAPDFAEGWHRRAVAFARAEMFGPAVADLERTLALEPRHFEAIAALGAILGEIDRFDLAVEAFERVLAIHPHHAEVTETLENLGSRAGGADL
ncbi:MAG: hypothetical protein QUV18_03645 [Roseovarius sp.]|nr:hypothetical protein [Roseovarius sp.]MDM8165018.1 hypothetical protein [Roseovarius sp.]